MLRNQRPAQNNYLYLWVIGAVAVGFILVVVGVLIGLMISGGGGSANPTALPEGYAQTAIVLTLAAYPTDTPVPTPIPTNTPQATNTLLPTLTPLVQATSTVANAYAYAAAAPTACMALGKEVPCSTFITPVSTEYADFCDCDPDDNVSCDDFGYPKRAQMCYDKCRATLCTEDNWEKCDPWGLDASDGSLDSEHYVCGFGS